MRRSMIATVGSMTVGAALLAAASAGSAQAAGGSDFSRYEVIVKRKPFLIPPENPGGMMPGLPGAPQAVKGSFAKPLKLVALEEDESGVTAGFVNVVGNDYFFLQVGEEKDGMQLMAVDYAERVAILKKDGEEVEMTMDATPGDSGPPMPGMPGMPGMMPPPAPAMGPAQPWRTPTGSAEARRESYLERLRKRREEMRMKAEEAKQPPLAGQDLEKHLRDYNLKLIRAKGELGPALPIPLTAEEDDQLVKEGVLPPP